MRGSQGEIARIISIHAPPRGATSSASRPTRGTYFNSRPSARGDPTDMHLVRSSSSFQFTPLREGRRGEALAASRADLFQFTPLREGRRTVARSAAASASNFNSRPSARGDAGVVVLRQRRDISIHAPPRGATPARGKPPLPSKNFNSRPSARGDQRHAAAFSAACHFNSRPSARGDMRRVSPLAASVFQFTPLREGRRRAGAQLWRW